jgi:hypothetical protein
VHAGFLWGGNRPLERHKNRREDNIKIDLQKREWGSWGGLIWLRTETMVRYYQHGNEPAGSIKQSKFLIF